MGIWNVAQNLAACLPHSLTVMHTPSGQKATVLRVLGSLTQCSAELCRQADTKNTALLAILDLHRSRVKPYA